MVLRKPTAQKKVRHRQPKKREDEWRSAKTVKSKRKRGKKCEDNRFFFSSFLGPFSSGHVAVAIYVFPLEVSSYTSHVYEDTFAILNPLTYQFSELQLSMPHWASCLPSNLPYIDAQIEPFRRWMRARHLVNEGCGLDAQIASESKSDPLGIWNRRGFSCHVYATFNRFRGDSAAILRIALWFQIPQFTAIWNHCDYDFAIWTSKTP